MFPQKYWYNSIKPDKLKSTERVFVLATRIHNIKYICTNSITHLETQERGKVYHYENEYDVKIRNTILKITLRESFHSCSMKPLNHPSIRGTSIITVKYNFNESTLNDDIKTRWTKFSNTLDKYIHANVETLQREYDAQHYWEHPSYYESDGSEPVPEAIASRQIL